VAAFPSYPTVHPARFRLVSAAAVVTGLLLLAAAASGRHLLPLLIVVDGVLLLAVLHRRLLRWEIATAGIVLSILLIPVTRYVLPGNLPFNLEPYRLLVGVVALGWLASLLGQPDARWRRTGFFLPLLAVGVTVVVSVGLNVGRLGGAGVQENVVKQISLFASFFVVMLLAAVAITTRRQLDVVVRALVVGGAIVAALSLVEYRTGFNAFNHLHTVLPVLTFNEAGLPAVLQERGGGSRIYGSAQHPIALSALLMMLIPLGLYMTQVSSQKRWWGATALIAMAALATVARTGTVMLLVELLVLLALRPRQMLRLWPYALPVILVMPFAAPEALGGIKSAFMPQGGLIAEQTTNAGQVSSNRLADVGPALREWSSQPLFGQGYGTRITDVRDPNSNALILDNQWLATLLETGLLGLLAVLWLFGRAVHRSGRASRRDQTPFGWLPSALAAAITGFLVGMLTFDAFAFAQVTFLCFVLIGLSVPAARLTRRNE
jgi:O-antigen ligase